VVKVLDPSVMASDQSGIAVFDLKVVNLADLQVSGGSSPVNVNYNNNYGVANKVLGKQGSVIKHKFDIALADESINYEVRNITMSIYWPEKFPGGAWLFPLEVVSFPSSNETDAGAVHCDHEDMIVTNWELLKEALTEPEQIYTNFSCKENKQLCRKITCKLDFLKRGSKPFKIHLATRLQEYFLKDFGQLEVTSYAELESVEETMTLSRTYTTNSATTSLAPSVARSQNYTIWIIIACIIALLILAVLIFILWKCKFFQRAKFGNLQPEPEPPTTVGYLVAHDEDQYNDYHNQQDKVLLPEKI
jgi:syndecan 4